MSRESMDRRSFLTVSLGGVAGLSLPPFLNLPLEWGPVEGGSPQADIKALVREPILFAGIRKPIQSRDELEPRIAILTETLGDRIVGPLTHIFRFDTPVEGNDSEIGFPVREAVNIGDVRSHNLRRMHFFSSMHEGSLATLGQTRARIRDHMNRVGLSQELEIVEVFHRRDPDHPDNQLVENQMSYLPWPEQYREELVRVLGEETAETIWEGGEAMTPFTGVDERCGWVAASIERLRQHATQEEQFDVLSRVALVRPPEEIAHLKGIYDEAGGNLQAVFDAQHAKFLESGRVRGRFDEPWFDGKALHLSKVPQDEKAYLAAETPEAIRKAFCFCTLVREASNPRIDPVFCYRAAGWDRQLFEALLGVEFKRCEITHSILKGDRFCAWTYHLE
jgi:hypothetical protein